MDLVIGYLEHIDWEMLLLSTVRILAIVFAAWIGLRVVARTMRKLEI